jgi:Tfp pilus assembly protein PilV
MKKNSQKGFTVVEAMLIVIIVGMLGGVGYYVWHSQQQVDKTYSQTANSSVEPKLKGSTSATSPGSSNAGYFVIKEWGIRAKNTYSITPEYKVQSNSGGTWAEVSSKELVAIDPTGCSLGSNVAGAIYQAKPTDHYYAGQPGSRPVQEEVNTGVLKNRAVKVGNYYYWYEPMLSGGCGTSKQDKEIYSRTVQGFTDLVKKLEVVPN